MIDDEPCTINADVVADYLAKHRQHGMAQFVRHLGRQCQTANIRIKEAQDRHADVVRELNALRPPEPKSEPVTYRSQWD